MGEAQLVGTLAKSLFGSQAWWRAAAALILAGFVAVSASEQSNAEPQYGVVIDQAYLNVPFDRQQTQVWCWVAAARMVAQYFNVATPSQCEMLTARYGAPCCQNPAMCTRPGYITEIQALVASFGLRYSSIGPPTDGWTLLNIFKSGRPIILHVNNSHFVVASGIRVMQTPQGPLGIVQILDPYFGPYEEPLPSLYQRWGAAMYVY